MPPRNVTRLHSAAGFAAVLAALFSVLAVVVLALDAESAVRERVKHLLEEHGTLEEVLKAIDGDSKLGALEKHAARNVLHRLRG